VKIPLVAWIVNRKGEVTIPPPRMVYLPAKDGFGWVVSAMEVVRESQHFMIVRFPIFKRTLTVHKSTVFDIEADALQYALVKQGQALATLRQEVSEAEKRLEWTEKRYRFLHTRLHGFPED